MTMRLVTATTAWAAASLACQLTTSIGATAGDGSSSGSPTSTAGTDVVDGSASTGGWAGGSTSLGVPDLGAGSSTDATTSEAAEAGSSDTGPPGPPMCIPAMFDSPCIACAKQSCCPEFGACAQDFECGCTLGCLQYPGFPGPCMCAPSPLAGDLVACLDGPCDFVCPPF